jgi:hypothetical protein
MTEYICTSDMVCIDQTCRQVKASLKSKKSIWDGLKQLLGVIGDYAVEIYRTNNDPQPNFSNGGTRVIIRPDRIDLA